MITIKNLIQLVIPEYIILIFFSVLSYALIIHQGPPNLDLLLFPFLAMSFGMFGLNILNNIVDLNLDRINKPARPLPSGRIEINEAKLMCILSFLLALLFSSLINFLSFIIMVIFIFLAYIYSVPPFRLNRHFLGSSIIGGIEYSAIPCLLVWQSMGGELSILFFMIFYLLVFFGPNIKDFEDIKSEKKLGYKTLPILIGKKNSAILIIASYLLINSFVGIWTFLGFLRTSFLCAVLINYFLLLILIGVFIKKINKKEVVITQSNLMTYSMVIVSLMQLGYGAVMLWG